MTFEICQQMYDVCVNVACKAVLSFDEDGFTYRFCHRCGWDQQVALLPLGVGNVYSFVFGREGEDRRTPRKATSCRRVKTPPVLRSGLGAGDP